MNRQRFLAVSVAFFWLGFPGALTAQRKAGELKLEPYSFDERPGRKGGCGNGATDRAGEPNQALRQIRRAALRSVQEHRSVAGIARRLPGRRARRLRDRDRARRRFPLFMAMREVADVIALDQRGTGLSEPRLVCPETLDYPLDRPGHREEMLHLMTGKARSCAESFRSQGVDLSAYNTSESADDLESLRVALGAPKISLWSISYGTHLALAALRRHEKGIDRVILAGVEGPDHTAKLPGNIQKALETVNELMKKDPAVRSKIPDFMSLIRQLGARLDQGAGYGRNDRAAYS